jgi:hypothetical protein
MSRTDRDPIVFGAERVLLGVQIADQFVVFDSNNPPNDSAVLLSIAPANGTSRGLDDALYSGTSYAGGRRVLKAQDECGAGLHGFQTFGNTADLDAIRAALPHFLQVSTDHDLRDVLTQIGQHLGMPIQPEQSREDLSENPPF